MEWHCQACNFYLNSDPNSNSTNAAAPVSRAYYRRGLGCLPLVLRFWKCSSRIASTPFSVRLFGSLLKHPTMGSRPSAVCRHAWGSIRCSERPELLVSWCYFAAARGSRQMLIQQRHRFGISLSVSCLKIGLWQILALIKACFSVVRN